MSLKPRRRAGKRGGKRQHGPDCIFNRREPPLRYGRAVPIRRGRAPANMENEDHTEGIMFIFRILRRAIGGLALLALAAGIIALSACGSYVPHEPDKDNPGETPGIEQPDESPGDDTEDLTT